jgi:hypothetical protein
MKMFLILSAKAHLVHIGTIPLDAVHFKAAFLGNDLFQIERRAAFAEAFKNKGKATAIA